MDLLKKKRNESSHKQLCGYQHKHGPPNTDSWWLEMGYTNQPSGPFSDQWWIRVLKNDGCDMAAETAAHGGDPSLEENNTSVSVYSAAAGNCNTPEGSSFAPSGFKPVVGMIHDKFTKLKKSGDYHLMDKDMLKELKKCKRIPCDSHEHHPKKKPIISMN